MTDEAFAELYRRWWPLVFGVCFRSSRDHHRAEDLAQETFVRVWRSPPTLDGDGQWMAWLRVVASRVCVDAHHRRPHTTDVDIDLTEHPDRARDVTPAPSVDVALALDALPPDERVAFRLHDLEGLPRGRVAEELATTPGKAEALVLRARHRLRSSLRGAV